MNKSSLLDLLDQLEHDVQEARRLVEADIMSRVRDGWNGHPRSPSFEAGSGPRRPEDLADELRGSLDYADPVGRVVADSNGHDRAAQDERQMERDLRNARVEVARFVAMAGRYKPRVPSLFDQQEAKDPDPGCVSCARVASPGTVGRAKRDQTPWWNPVHIEATIDGEKVPLCRWCWETPTVGARATGNLPDKADVESYRDTGRARKRTA